MISSSEGLITMLSCLGMIINWESSVALYSRMSLTGLAFMNAIASAGEAIGL